MRVEKARFQNLAARFPAPSGFLLLRQWGGWEKSGGVQRRERVARARRYRDKSMRRPTPIAGQSLARRASESIQRTNRLSLKLKRLAPSGITVATNADRVKLCTEPSPTKKHAIAGVLRNQVGQNYFPGGAPKPPPPIFFIISVCIKTRASSYFVMF